MALVGLAGAAALLGVSTLWFYLKAVKLGMAAESNELTQRLVSYGSGTFKGAMTIIALNEFWSGIAHWLTGVWGLLAGAVA